MIQCFKKCISACSAWQVCDCDLFGMVKNMTLAMVVGDLQGSGLKNQIETPGWLFGCIGDYIDIVLGDARWWFATCFILTLIWGNDPCNLTTCYVFLIIYWYDVHCCQ